MSTEIDLEATALHEAGHVIAAIALGLNPGFVRVEQVEQGWKGSSDCSPTDADRFRASVVGSAGMLAEARLSYREPREGYESDMSWVWTAAADLNRTHHPELGSDPKDCLAYVVVAAGAASRLLIERWIDVQTLADRLVETNEIVNPSTLVDVDAIRSAWSRLQGGVAS